MAGGTLLRKNGISVGRVSYWPFCGEKRLDLCDPLSLVFVRAWRRTEVLSEQVLNLAILVVVHQQDICLADRGLVDNAVLYGEEELVGPCGPTGKE